LSRFVGWASHGIKRTGWNIEPRTALSGLALVCGLALLAAFYLALASQTAMLGRHLQEMEATRVTTVYENAHLRDQIARIASAARLRQRAIAAGFVTTGTVIFLPVDPSPVLDSERQQGPP
jgi:cell division protein FtsB